MGGGAAVMWCSLSMAIRKYNGSASLISQGRYQSARQVQMEGQGSVFFLLFDVGKIFPAASRRVKKHPKNFRRFAAILTQKIQ